VEQTIVLLWAMSVLRLHEQPGYKRLHLSLAATALRLPPGAPRQPHLLRMLLEARMLLAAELRASHWRALSRRWQRRLAAGGAAAAPAMVESWPGALLELQHMSSQGQRHSERAAAAVPAAAAPALVLTARRPGHKPGAGQLAMKAPVGAAAAAGSSGVSAARQWGMAKAQVLHAAEALGLEATWRLLSSGEEVCMVVQGQQQVALWLKLPWHVDQRSSELLASGDVLQRVLRSQGLGVVGVELREWVMLQPVQQQQLLKKLL
jgi:hypothetical protein